MAKAVRTESKADVVFATHLNPEPVLETHGFPGLHDDLSAGSAIRRAAALTKISKSSHGPGFTFPWEDEAGVPSD